MEDKALANTILMLSARCTVLEDILIGKGICDAETFTEAFKKEYLDIKLKYESTKKEKKK